MVDLLERLEVLLEQELLSYRTEDYLDPGFQQRLQVSYADENQSHSSSFSTNSSSTSASGINEVWREKICEWSYQVIDHFDFSREVVSISIHYLDRYLSARPVNKKVFQLAAMTSLYLAIKLYEPAGTLSMKSMIELCRGFFLVEQMEEMEMTILR
jgi:lipoyl(octanoyl) transferase